MFLAGGLAGLAGCNEILGIQIRMIPEISPGYGFDGIAVSLIGNNTPFGIVIGALLFGAFRAGGNRMQIRAKVPNAIVSVVQALVIFAVVASQMLQTTGTYVWTVKAVDYNGNAYFQKGTTTLIR